MLSTDAIGDSDMSQDTRKLPDGFDWRAFTPDDSPLTPMDVMADPRHQDLQTATVTANAPRLRLH